MGSVIWGGRPAETTSPHVFFLHFAAEIDGGHPKGKEEHAECHGSARLELETCPRVQRVGMQAVRKGLNTEQFLTWRVKSGSPGGLPGGTEL